MRKARKRFVTAHEFTGEDFPPETIVQYRSKGKDVYGIVWRQLFEHATVIHSDRTLHRVAYNRLQRKMCAVTPPAYELHEIQEFAHVEMNKRQLFEYEWRFGFDVSESRAGQCDYQTRTLTATLTYCAVAPAEEIIDTILHEIAHAMCKGHGHDKLWQATAMAIGCKDVNRTRNCRSFNMAKRWRGECGCGLVWRYTKLPERAKMKQACARCGKIIWFSDVVDTLSQTLFKYEEAFPIEDNFTTRERIKKAAQQYKKYGVMKDALEEVGLKPNPYNYTKLRKEINGRHKTPTISN